MSDEDMQMDHDEMLRAMFFSTEEEVAALKAERESEREAKKARRRSRKTRDDIKALKAFVRLIEQVDARDRQAAVLYLVDRYLGKRPAQHARQWV